MHQVRGIFYFYRPKQHKMTKPYRLLLFFILIFSIAIAVIVYRYEFLLRELRADHQKTQNLGSVKGGFDSDKILGARLSAGSSASSISHVNTNHKSRQTGISAEGELR